MKFGVVGVSNTLLSLVAFQVLIAGGLGATVSSALAFAVGAVNGYCWNRSWTFAAADTTKSRLRYLLVQLGSLGLTSALVWSLDRARVAPTISYLIAMACVTLATFTANRLFTFGPSAKDTPRAPARDATEPPPPGGTQTVPARRLTLQRTLVPAAISAGKLAAPRSNGDRVGFALPEASGPSRGASE